MAMNNRTWAAMSAAALLLSIVTGIVLYVFTGDAFNVLWAVLIIFGLYLGITSLFRNGEGEGFGPSSGDVTLVGGIILAGIGACGIIQSCIHNVLITVAAFIAIVAITGIAMALKNRNK
jgi:hypothetical protein